MDLKTILKETLSPEAYRRRRGVLALKEAAKLPNYGESLINIVKDDSDDVLFRETAVVHFKNWVTHSVLTSTEKQLIRDSILSLMDGTYPRPRIHSIISEIVTCIGGENYFLGEWPLDNLLNKLQSHLMVGDYDKLNSILAIMNSLFKTFRHEFMSEKLLEVLKDCVGKFADPLMSVFKRAAEAIEIRGDGFDVETVLECERACFQIFYSLNYTCVDPSFENEMAYLLDQFKVGLSKRFISNKLFLLQSSICESMSLLLKVKNEKFLIKLEELCYSVFSLLEKVSKIDDMTFEMEKVIVDGIKFLILLLTNFQTRDWLKFVIEIIVIPNVKLGPMDVDLFETNYMKYFRREIEGNNRRSMAYELLKGLTLYFGKDVLGILKSHSDKALSSFLGDPLQNWALVDSFIYIYSRLTTEIPGESFISSVGDPFMTSMLRELESGKFDDFPLLKAGALKGFTMSCNKTNKRDVMMIIQYISLSLDSKWNVVHSCAASCIEKLAEDGVIVDTSVLMDLMSKLFRALQLPESEDNVFVMMCIKQILGVSKLSLDAALPCLKGLMKILGKICENPICPLFYQAVFESVSVLIGQACEENELFISNVGGALLNELHKIVGNGVTELFPCTFQLLVELVDICGKLSDDSWKKSAPQLLMFIHDFLIKAPQDMIEILPEETKTKLYKLCTDNNLTIP